MEVRCAGGAGQGGSGCAARESEVVQNMISSRVFGRLFRCKGTLL